MLERYVIAEKSGAAVVSEVLQRTLQNFTLPLGTAVVKFTDHQQTVERLERECLKWQEVASLRTAGDAKFLREMELLKKDKADLQIQLVASEEERRKVSATCDMLGRERNAADEAVYDLKQQVAQLREERDALRDSVCDMNNDLIASDAQVESLGSELTTLRGLVEEREYEIKRRIWQMHGARMGHQLYGDDGRLDCNTCFRKYSDESIETVYGFELYDANILCAKAATLPREGGAQEVKNAL